ncbi:hypothetical protein F2Q69_00013645 [Brassica cretica]|uniref:Secreted protein n=1 Tax=Brassica cretica TaxID=69181 RepID=A0A8S9QRB2_BRACR|nr:hypothetical protein F2Q69_00013645 [Brassica cretica]
MGPVSELLLRFVLTMWMVVRARAVPMGSLPSEFLQSSGLSCGSSIVLSNRLVKSTRAVAAPCRDFGADLRTGYDP